jgi:hypothetical protein
MGGLGLGRGLPSCAADMTPPQVSQPLRLRAHICLAQMEVRNGSTSAAGAAGTFECARRTEMKAINVIRPKPTMGARLPTTFILALRLEITQKVDADRYNRKPDTIQMTDHGSNFGDIHKVPKPAITKAVPRFAMTVDQPLVRSLACSIRERSPESATECPPPDSPEILASVPENVESV